MLSKRLILTFMMASTLLMQGCNNVPVKGGKVTFKLSKGINTNEYKGYDGKAVEFYGYTSIDHLDNEYLVITLNPEGFCPFHTDVALEEYMAIPVKLKEGIEKPENIYRPVKVEGVIKVGSFKDSANHTFDLIVDDATVTTVDGDFADGILKNYVELADLGVFSKLREAQVSIDEAFGYKIFGKGLSDLKHVSIEELKEVKEDVLRIEDENLEDLVKVIDLAIELGEFVNNALYKQDLDLLNLGDGGHSDIINKAYEMFETYQRWQLKYSI